MNATRRLSEERLSTLLRCSFLEKERNEDHAVSLLSLSRL
jgi:hypothetical protein